MNRDLRFTALKKTPFHSRTSLASRTNKYYNWNKQGLAWTRFLQGAIDAKQ